MQQNYSSLGATAANPFLFLRKNRTIFLVALLSLTFAMYILSISRGLNVATNARVDMPEPPMANSELFTPPFRTASVDDVVSKALYLKTLLTNAQVATLQQTYTTTLARKWSNLPCGAGCRNGIQLGTLTATQLAAALDVIQTAAGTVSNEGYDEFRQIRLADKYLSQSGGGSGYDSTLYFLSFLNTPSPTGAWMLQFGGHHYAANIAFNGGQVVGTTPSFQGVEPRTFVINNVTYSPLKQERDSMIVMLASLTSAQLATAKITNTYSDVLLSPGESNGNTNTFPATKAGLRANTLTTAQKNLVLGAMKNYTSDADNASGTILQNLYASKIDSTYIAWTGNGTAGDSSTFLTANTNYVRIDGPDVWIEFICQNGVVFQSQIHYHTVYRDHNRDYGTDLTRTSLPLNLLSFDALIQGKGRMLSWTTADEKSVSYFEVQRATDPATGYSTIKTVSSSGNGNHTYSYQDNGGVDEDVIYYRLKMVDVDGYSRFSNVAVVKYNTVDNKISLYPNPASDFLTIANPEPLQDATIRIISNAGTTVFTSANRTGRKLNVDISNLPPGSYLVQIISKKGTSSLKFIKTK